MFDPIYKALLVIKALGIKQVEVISRCGWSEADVKNHVTDFTNKSESICDLKEFALWFYDENWPIFNFTFSVSLNKDEHKATGGYHYKAKVGDLYLTFTCVPKK